MDSTEHKTLRICHLNGDILRIVHHNGAKGLAKKTIPPFEVSLLEYCSPNSPHVMEAQTPLIEFIETRTEDAFDLAVIKISEKEYQLNIWCGENIFGCVPDGSEAQTKMVEQDTKIFMPIIKLFMQGRRPK